MLVDAVSVSDIIVTDLQLTSVSCVLYSYVKQSQLSNPYPSAFKMELLYWLTHLQFFHDEALQDIFHVKLCLQKSSWGINKGFLNKMSLWQQCAKACVLLTQH